MTSSAWRTISTATGLTKRSNCRCFSFYERPSETPKDDCFVAEFISVLDFDLDEAIDILMKIENAERWEVLNEQ